MEPARTLGAYAVALLHGATLADFERDNLIALAAGVGVEVTDTHRDMAAKRDARETALAQEIAQLRGEVYARRGLFHRVFRSLGK